MHYESNLRVSHEIKSWDAWYCRCVTLFVMSRNLYCHNLFEWIFFVIFLVFVPTGVPLPDGWSIQPKDSSGKEKDVHLVQICPSKNAAEFNRVADEVKKTASITISKIERVQNPGLYRSYVVKKDQMDKKNGSNEKFLFHGTGKSSCSTINSYGFNRSYSGKNGELLKLESVFISDRFLSSTRIRHIFLHTRRTEITVTIIILKLA